MTDSPELRERLPRILAERVERERFDEALLVARLMSRLEPGSCPILRSLAGVEARAGRTAAAETTFARAASLCPVDAAMLADHGRALLARGCPAEAVSMLERSVLLEPGDPRSRGALAAARDAVARTYAAADAELAALEQEIGIQIGSQDGNRSERLQARWREALRAIGRRSQAERDNPEAALRLAEFYRLGRELGVDGAEERAFEHVRRALDLRWTSSEALVLLGSLELTRAEPDPDAAERAFLWALALDDARPLAGAWSGLFFAHVAQSRLAAALADARAYLALVPDDLEFRAVRDEVERRLRYGAGQR